MTLRETKVPFEQKSCTNSTVMQTLTPNKDIYTYQGWI